MRVVRINTTAFKEEDFYLLTTLDDSQIAEVIQPIVNAERDGYEEFANEDLFRALTDRFPNDKINMFYEFDNLTI
jgi:hypothetical protein